MLTRVNEIPNSEVCLNPSEVCCNVFLWGDEFTETMLLIFFVRFLNVAEKVLNVLFLHVGM